MENSEALHVNENISEAVHKPFRCAIPAPQQYSHRAYGLFWWPFYLSNYKISQLSPSPLHTGDKLWVIKEQSTNATWVSSRIFPMVELIKKREENQRMLRGHCCLLRCGRIIQGKHPFITRCRRKSQTKLCFQLFVLPWSTFFSLQFSTKIQGIFAACHEGITSHQGIAPCQGRRSHGLTRIIQESVLRSNLTNWAGCTNPPSLRISVLSFSLTQIK